MEIRSVLSMPLMPMRSSAPATLVSDPTDCFVSGAAEQPAPAAPVAVVEDPQQPAPPVLTRPVIFVHGYNSGDYVWNELSWYLQGDGPPVNPPGGTYEAAQPGYLDPQGKLFNLKFSKPWQSAAKNADELERALEAVAKATGADKIDVVAHSMGCLNTRLYLDRGGSRVGKLIMLAPPNHGSIQANSELWMREHLGVPVFPPNSDPDVKAALMDLRVHMAPEENGGECGNPFLHELNQRWDEQVARTEGVTIMVGGGVPTLEPDGSTTVQGDGFVPWSSSVMPGVRLETYIDPTRDTHGRLLRDPEVTADVGRFLTSR